MTKRTKSPKSTVTATTDGNVVELHFQHDEQVAEDLALAELELDEPAPKSVVADKYKSRYAARGNPRGCGDWLQSTLAPLTLDPKGKLRVPEFEAILEANGVRHAHWNRTTPGWQGRLRMSGGAALRTIVANAAVLVLADGVEVEAPVAFCDRHAR